MNQQLKLFKATNKTSFGGDLLGRSNPKVKRPFSPKASMHVVLKAKSSCLKYYDQRVENLIKKQARKHFIPIYSIQNVGNHIHLVLKARRRVYLARFLRGVCGLIPRLLKKAGIWLKRPFSRAIHWGKAYKTIQNYMTLNKYQSEGYTKSQARYMLERDQIYFSIREGP